MRYPLQTRPDSETRADPQGRTQPDAESEAEAQANDDVWQREFLSHWPEYAAELVGTAFLLFCVVVVVAWMLADGSPIPQWIPSQAARLFFTGLLLGAAGGIVALTPLGKLSGAHLNPAVSIGFWVLGKMHGADVFGYIAAQCPGQSAAPGWASRWRANWRNECATPRTNRAVRCLIRPRRSPSWPPLAPSRS